jgi:hypothetical protein
MYPYPTPGNSSAEIKYRQDRIRDAFRAGTSRGTASRRHHHLPGRKSRQDV